MVGDLYECMDFLVAGIIGQVLEEFNRDKRVRINIPDQENPDFGRFHGGEIDISACCSGSHRGVIRSRSHLLQNRNLQLPYY